MTQYMLDINICIYLLSREDAALNVMARMQTGQVTMSSIVYGELYAGARDDGRDEAITRLAHLVREVPVTPFDASAAQAYGDLRRSVDRVGAKGFDLLIAAHAISRGVVLVTNNEADFRRFADLKLENWTSR